MYSNIYFIGIGGIGMSAIARYYHLKGMKVSGYDKTPSELTHKLELEGIAVHYEDDVRQIPSDRENTLVVYTPAVPKDLREMVYVMEKGYKVIKRSRMLGEITQDQCCLAIAGTHGKTTTSTLLAHILHEGGEGCSAFLGGISKNYDTNMLVSQSKTVVAEADEFDRSFLQLYPGIAAITSMSPDHLDIYGNVESYRQAFKDFAAQVSGTLVFKKGLPINVNDTKAKIYSYHFDDCEADFHAENIKADKLGYFSYDLVSPMGTIEGIKTAVPGWINVENSIAAAAVSLCHGIEAGKIKDAIGTYQGVKRRLDIQLNTANLSYIDDYAHHPEELASAISSMREIFPGRKLTAVFQPHLYTRTRDFAEGFAQSLSMVDKLILLDIYPAREDPIEGVSSEMIFDKVNCPEKVLLKKEELMDYIEKDSIDVLATFGAGDIDRYIKPLSAMLRKRLV